MQFELSPQAQRDLAGLIEFYTERSPAMTDRFATAYERLIDRLEAFPSSSPIVGEEVRRAQVPGFPLGLFYVLRGDRGGRGADSP